MRVARDQEVETLAGVPEMDQQLTNDGAKGSVRWWAVGLAIITSVALVIGAVLPRIQARTNLRK
ncbi:MAG: hypothetical protein JOZ36_06695, partial [Acidobacteria bacterium]|nr:hypothetical protein [Acidobacteriota bacterium]